MRKATEAEVLRVVSEAPYPVSSKEIAERLGFETGNRVMHQLTALEAQGFVARRGRGKWDGSRIALARVAQALELAAGWYRRRDPDIARFLSHDALHLRGIVVRLEGNGDNR